MAKKMDRTAHEPGWAEVILGAALSVVLGAVLGALALVFKPVEIVKELPKDPQSGVVYVLRGSRDNAKAKNAATKRTAFVKGQSGTIVVTEDELNSLVPAPAPAPAAGAPKAPAPAPKAGEKPAAPAAKPADASALTGPNFRIADSKVQVLLPVNVEVVGASVPVTAQGGFVKSGDHFVFSPDTLYVGSLPAQRIPFAAGLLQKNFLKGAPIPDDIAAAWAKVSDVAVEGSTLKLTMP